MTTPLPVILGWIWCGSELGLTIVKRSKGDAIAKDRHSLGLIWLITLAAVTLGVVAAYKLHRCQLPWRSGVFTVGCSLAVLGLALRWRAIFHLGRFFTTNVAIAKDHYVVDTGPYHFVRHPSYTGSLMAALGFSLSFGNWVSLPVVFIPICAVTLWRIHIEEDALAGGLGQPYREYMQRTKRLIPKIY